MSALDIRGAVSMDSDMARWMDSPAAMAADPRSGGSGACCAVADPLPSSLRTACNRIDEDDEPAAIDDAAWSEFVDLMRDEDDFSGVLDTVAEFLEDTAVHMETLNRAFLAGDGAALKKTAHHLKSSCGNLGACTMSRLLAELESAAATTETVSAAIAKLMLQTEEEWARVDAEFNVRCAALGGLPAAEA